MQRTQGGDMVMVKEKEVVQHRGRRRELEGRDRTTDIWKGRQGALWTMVKNLDFRIFIPSTTICRGK